MRQVRSRPEAASWEVVVDSCMVRAKRRGELTGPIEKRLQLPTRCHGASTTEGQPHQLNLSLNAMLRIIDALPQHDGMVSFGCN